MIIHNGLNCYVQVLFVSKLWYSLREPTNIDDVRSNNAQSRVDEKDDDDLSSTAETSYDFAKLKLTSK
jgi:hypothetical protein